MIIVQICELDGIRCIAKQDHFFGETALIFGQRILPLTSAQASFVRLPAALELTHLVRTQREAHSGWWTSPVTPSSTGTGGVSGATGAVP